MTTTVLSSFVTGKWVKGTGKPSLLVNPSTEEAVCETSTEGIDFAAALAFAKDVGGPALRKKTFKERGEMLRALSRAIHAKRDDLIALAIKNGGNTRSDAKFDIDGASGTLAAYADLGAELGDAHILADGDATQLGRSARLFGQHIMVPREGVAVHVNAFNFPAWGLAEKAACALLAGMPVVSKPATSTALVAHRIMELLVEANALPEGALSFICGSPGNLLDLLTGQDVLAFTGSSITGATLRSGKGPVERSVRVNVEADSLNAAVLGPDQDDGAEAFGLFCTDVVRDMQQKTGQKCTAIRRVLVPKDKIAKVVEALSERLSSIKVGNPEREDVTMGPLATAQQKRDVESGAKKLEDGARVVYSAKEKTALGAPEGKGFFFWPTLLQNDAATAASAVNNHEVFGPVATVIAFDGTAADAKRIVAMGGGGLVASVYSDDKEFTREAVLGIAAHHGRVTIGSSKVASQAIPPGTVMPQLIHGGPGRAGAGEELGGRRGLAFYMQRTALQGDKALLDAMVGRK
jgi:oxepin-CoA hydrolase/3-oxo-5,6-dehydrosuberyl-CoA semialdehyde dehydrogenase